MAEGYVCAVDQGTSSSRVMVFDRAGSVVSSHQLEHKQYYPKSGYVEHDPLEIWERVSECAREAIRVAKLREGGCDIRALGITNQRETTVVWNRFTGKPYHNAIVWNDARTEGICERLSAQHGGPNAFRSKTGLPIATYFSASKLIYLLETVPGLRADAEKGSACFGTIDSWLIFKLTCGKVHVTDVSNASRTLLMNLETLQWDENILTALNIPKAMLPEIRSSSEVMGRVLSVDELMGVEIAGVLGDQQAALFGQCCFDVGDAKCTYGTGAFLLLNTGQGKQGIVHSNRGLLTTVAYQLGRNEPPTYALEGSVAYCGSLIQWLRDNMELFTDVSQSQSMAAGVEDNGGVYFVPAFSGLFAPYWRSEARGVIVGLTAYNTKAHVIRAALEAAAFQVKDVLDAMGGVRSLRVDGGFTRNDLAMQFQCDLVDVPLRCPKIPEMTALGAAYVAGLAVGYWSSKDQLRRAWQEGVSWTPRMNAGQRNALLLHWRKAVARSMGWLETAGVPATHSSSEDPHLVVLDTSLSSRRSKATTWVWALAAVALGFAGGVAFARRSGLRGL